MGVSLRIASAGLIIKADIVRVVSCCKAVEDLMIVVPAALTGAPGDARVASGCHKNEDI